MFKSLIASLFHAVPNVSNLEITLPSMVSASPRHRVGPGKKTVYTYHRAIGRSKYQPHQGRQEIARRVRQMERLGQA